MARAGYKPAPTTEASDVKQHSQSTDIIKAFAAACALLITLMWAFDAKGEERPAGTPAATVQADRGMVLAEPDDGITLTAEEYEQFKQLVKIGRATPLQVGSVTGASVGIVILLAGTAYIGFLVLLRYVFNRWFDQDVYTKTWPSTVVICVMILGAVAILCAAVVR